jgi:mannose-6-phosphate isomerase-like protein (cupin superfamily)
VLEVIVQAPRFQVNRLTLRPGAGISLQKHHRRSEHWIVVQGTALVTRGNQQLTVKTDESVFIPPGVIHRIQNPEKSLLEVIEVQTGDDLGDGDTLRLEAPLIP